MLTPAPIVVETTALGDAKAYLRIATDDDDALVTMLLAAAIGHGEMFTGRLFLQRAVSETAPVACAWARLGAGPVSAITTVEAGGATLPVEAYAIDIDANGDGWVRLTQSGSAKRLTVGYTAGLAPTWEALPEPLRQGAVRLASHLYAHRDEEDGGAPPAAVAALWRPWRRMQLR